MNRKIVIIVVLFIVGIIGIFLWKKISTTKTVFCTADAMLCPDGSAVGRVGPNCEFAPCPSSLPTNNRMTEAEAKTIAEKICIKGGEALGSGIFNENSNTWWFDANLNAAKEGCNPACVVDATTKQAEINWRCTGLITD